MGEDVATAVIGGRLVMEDRRFLTLDVAALYQEVRAAARTIGDEQRRRAEMLQRMKPYYQRWYTDWLGVERPAPRDVGAGHQASCHLY
jgi:5-methylthioadenosine/S-adenosylhomocysteine deaminase